MECIKGVVSCNVWYSFAVHHYQSQLQAQRALWLAASVVCADLCVTAQAQETVAEANKRANAADALCEALAREHAEALESAALQEV